ncbi:MAG: DUF2167 domain-containing protein [Burkholderiaceae bacterium]|nr:MAG: DUF2167 domain-containing protein [Burkholderiaceae bacterium]
MRYLARYFWLAPFLLLFGFSAQAMNPAAEAELEAAYKDVETAIQQGPVPIPLLDQAILKLPEGYGFVPNPAAARLMRALGNQADEGLLGLVMPLTDAQWMVVIEYEKAGYIKDDDAKEWNADDMYKSMQEGTEAGNEDRRKSGIEEIELTGWVEKPSYDAATHRLLWSIGVKNKGVADDSPGVNYNTLVLGREGYISMNMLTDKALIEGLKPIARDLLSTLEFKSDKSYAAFNSSTDKVAEYGLAALITGVAAKKLGLLAVIAAFFAKFAKVLFLAGAGAVYGVKKWLGIKSKSD